MSNQRYSPEFKDEAVRQVIDRGYSVAEVAERLGISAHSLHKWLKTVKRDKSDEQAAEFNEAKREILKLRAQLCRTTFATLKGANNKETTANISAKTWAARGQPIQESISRTDRAARR